MLRIKANEADNDKITYMDRIKTSTRYLGLTNIGNSKIMSYFSVLYEQFYAGFIPDKKV
jgi:hypothetical protein